VSARCAVLCVEPVLTVGPLVLSGAFGLCWVIDAVLDQVDMTGGGSV